jgi:hypothetical protein
MVEFKTRSNGLVRCKFMFKLKYWCNLEKAIARGWWRTRLIVKNLDTIQCIKKTQKRKSSMHLFLDMLKPSSQCQTSLCTFAISQRISPPLLYKSHALNNFNKSPKWIVRLTPPPFKL